MSNWQYVTMGYKYIRQVLKELRISDLHAVTETCIQCCANTARSCYSTGDFGQHTYIAIQIPNPSSDTFFSGKVKLCLLSHHKQ